MTTEKQVQKDRQKIEEMNDGKKKEGDQEEEEEVEKDEEDLFDGNSEEEGKKFTNVTPGRELLSQPCRNCTPHNSKCRYH